MDSFSLSANPFTSNLKKKYVHLFAFLTIEKNIPRLVESDDVASFDKFSITRRTSGTTILSKFHGKETAWEG